MKKQTVVTFMSSNLSTGEEGSLVRVFAEKIGQDGYDVIYGGGDLGDMKIVAQTAQRSGSVVTAYVLEKYLHEEQLPNVKIIPVEGDDDDRFKEFAAVENLCAFIAFPTGLAGFAETAQAIRYAGYENGPPVIIPDIADHYTLLHAVYKRAVDSGRVKPNVLNKVRLWRADQSLADVLSTPSL